MQPLLPRVAFERPHRVWRGNVIVMTAFLVPLGLLALAGLFAELGPSSMPDDPRRLIGFGAAFGFMIPASIWAALCSRRFARVLHTGVETWPVEQWAGEVVECKPMRTAAHMLTERGHGCRIRFDAPQVGERAFTVLNANMRPAGPVALPGDRVQVQFYPGPEPRTAGVFVERTQSGFAAMHRPPT